MYAYSAIGARISNNIDISSWWNPIGNLMKYRLENSQLIKERINSYIGKISWNSYSQTEHIDFKERNNYSKDMDLWLSVGNADDCKITVQKTGKKKWFSSKYKYIITIELSDKYDFDLFDPAKRGKILSYINNGLGYYPQNWGCLNLIGGK